MTLEVGRKIVVIKDHGKARAGWQANLISFDGETFETSTKATIGFGSFDEDRIVPVECIMSAAPFRVISHDNLAWSFSVKYYEFEENLEKIFNTMWERFGLKFLSTVGVNCTFEVVDFVKVAAYDKLTTP